MAEGPQVSVAAFGSIPPAHFVAVYVLKAKRPPTRAQLEAFALKFMDREQVEDAVQQLMHAGALAEGEGERLELTEVGAKATEEALGKDAKESRERLLERRFPIVALGLDPDDAEVRRRLGESANLVGAIVAVGFGLGSSQALSVKATTSELVWRCLRDHMPDIVGPGPFPAIDDPGVVGTTILAGLAGAPSPGANLGTVLKQLAATVIGAPSPQIEALRERLTTLALARATSAGSDDFVQRVRAVARGLHTPPFEGRVAIAQVFDAYAEQHDDAGSLEDFKERLVSAARARQLDLSSLDLPEYMTAELRERSATSWGEEHMHFVVSEWK